MRSLLSALLKKWSTMTSSSTLTDSTIREIRAIREQLSDKFDGDIGELLADARERQRSSGRVILQRREISATPAADICIQGSNALPIRSAAK